MFRGPGRGHLFSNSSYLLQLLWIISSYLILRLPFTLRTDTVILSKAFTMILKILINNLIPNCSIIDEVHFITVKPKFLYAALPVQMGMSMGSTVADCNSGGGRARFQTHMNVALGRYDWASRCSVKWRVNNSYVIVLFWGIKSKSLQQQHK